MKITIRAEEKKKVLFVLYTVWYHNCFQTTEYMINGQNIIRYTMIILSQIIIGSSYDHL